MSTKEWEATLKRRKEFEDAVSDGFEYIRKTQDLGEQKFYTAMLEAAKSKDPTAVTAVRDEAISWLTAEKAKRDLLA